MIRPKQNKHRTPDNVQDAANTLVDDLAEFVQYREEILPALRKALVDGLSAEEIYSKFQAYAAARAVSIAAKEVDSGKALAAIKDILDRSGGKAAERKEITHTLGKLPDEQLDSLLLSKLAGSEAAAEDDNTSDDMH